MRALAERRPQALKGNPITRLERGPRRATLPRFFVLVRQKSCPFPVRSNLLAATLMLDRSRRDRLTIARRFQRRVHLRRSRPCAGGTLETRHTSRWFRCPSGTPLVVGTALSRQWNWRAIFGGPSGTSCKRESLPSIYEARASRRGSGLCGADVRRPGRARTGDRQIPESGDRAG